MAGRWWRRLGLDASFVSLAAAASAFLVLPLLVADPLRAGRELGCWFDPLFLSFNSLLVFAAVILSPLFVYAYIRTKREEKRELLQESVWSAHSFADAGPAQDHRRRIDQLIGEHFRFGNYVHSLLGVMFVTACGASLIALLKPLPEPGCGIDYGRGANVLLLGPLIEYVRPGQSLAPAVYHRIIVSLTAFQFGFLGAFLHYVQHLFRSYFALDISPSTFVFGSARMVTSSLLALVASFLFPAQLGDPSSALLGSLPVVAFFLGYFPDRAMLLIERQACALLRIAQVGHRATPLSRLRGMSLLHEVRLEREGCDNMENLLHIDALDFAVRTSFRYEQIRSWIGEAWLQLHLGEEDCESFARETGITTRDELRRCLQSWAAEDPAAKDPPWAVSSVGRAKLECIALLLQDAGPASSGGRASAPESGR